MARMGQCSLGSMRLGAARLGYHNRIVYVTIDGVRREDNTRKTTLQIRAQTGSAPTTATMRVWGFTPAFGQEVKIYTGAITPQTLEFAGHIQRVHQVYEQLQGNVAYDLELIDYTWLLDFALVFKSYVNVSATVIATSLLPSGFTALKVEAGLPPVTIAFNGIARSQALTQLA